MTVKLKRAYDLPAEDDGERYLVERLWPRGVTKAELALTAWLRTSLPARSCESGMDTGRNVGQSSYSVTNPSCQRRISRRR